MKNSINESDLLQTGNLEFLAKQAVEGFITGLHKSPFHGFSVEFAEHKQYNPGESLRYVDWRLFARTGKMFSKRFEEETNLRCHILLDCSSSMYIPENGLNKIKFSVYAAASLLYLLRKQRDACGISLFDNGISFHSPARSSMVHQKQMFAQLENVLHSNKTNTKTQISTAIHQLAESIHRRSLIVIFTDALENESDDLFKALQHLRFNKHEVIFFHVCEKSQEVDFNFENRPHLFVDSETNEKIKVNPAQIRSAYLQKSSQFFTEVKTKCMQQKIDFYQAFVSTDFNSILLPFFAKRSKLF